jgi:hypothetical protein
MLVLGLGGNARACRPAFFRVMNPARVDPRLMFLQAMLGPFFAVDRSFNLLSPQITAGHGNAALRNPYRGLGQAPQVPRGRLDDGPENPA